MKRLSFFILVFSIAFLVFFIGPPFLGKQFAAYPLMKNGDVLDIFTPLILIPLYWLLFQENGGKAPGLKESTVFIVFAAFWVIGQGMHLSANSIGHLLKGMEGNDIYILTNFYDEVLSHYLWHFGIIGLSSVLIYHRWLNPFAEERRAPWAPILAGIIHGFTFFLIVVEGATTPMGVPFAVLVTLFGFTWGRKKIKGQPLLLFFFVAYLVATVFFLGWGIYWRGLPEFSKVGIID